MRIVPPPHAPKAIFHNRHDKSTRIEPNTILSPCPAICSLARRIGGSPVKYEDVPPPHAPNAIFHTRQDESTRIEPNTILPPLLDNNDDGNDDDGNDDLGCCCCVLKLPLLSVPCFYTALHCYNVTITNNTNKHTCNNIF